LERVGALLFASGLITYFVFIPGVFHPEYYRSWGPSLLLFSVLDAYIVLRVVSILRGRVRPEWVRPYRWLGATYFIWFVADLAEVGIKMGWVPGFDSGSPLDTLWHLPLLLLLVVLSRGWPGRTNEEQDNVEDATQRMDSLAPERTSLVAYALALPSIHFTLTLLGIQSDAILVHREVLLLIIVLALAALLMLQQHVLRQLTHSIVADRRLVADQLHIAQRMEAVGRLASGVAHDFSNILSVIRGRAELLLMTGGAGNGADDVNEIVEASRRGQALVTHLLTLGRRKSADAEVFDLSKVVGDLKPLLERVLPDSIDVRVLSGDQGIPTVQADRAQLEQVVLNLVVNARDAMPSGGRLTLSTEIVQVEDHFAVVNGGARGGEYVMLRVADTGTGVPSELRHLVFEPFFTTKDEELGTGLGLSIVYGVAQQAHGFVRIDDAEGGGAIFEVYLPKATRQPSADRRRQRRAPARGRETILLVEDYDSLRRTTARVLQETGYRVLEAGNAVEALAILDRRNERIELLLADLVLPDLSGFEVAERAVKQIPDLATVFISGYPDGVTQLRRPESATVLEKPFSPEVLMFTVRRALDERKASTG
jgi:signal transduction histidine kinase